MLLEAGADPDFVDNEGQTPLHYAVRHGKLGAVERLIGTMAVDLAREDAKGQGLVSLALKQKRTTIADFLVKAGCPPPAGTIAPSPVVSGNAAAFVNIGSSITQVIDPIKKIVAVTTAVIREQEVDEE